MDFITKKDIAKYGLIGVIVFLLTLSTIIVVNGAIATAIFWAFNALTPWTVELTLKNGLAGGIIISAINFILYHYRGDN